MCNHDPDINIDTLPLKGSAEVEAMASTSRRQRKRVREAAEILEESTDSDVTIFFSEEDYDNETSENEDRVSSEDNLPTNQEAGTSTNRVKTAQLKWSNNVDFKELEKYENVSGPKHSLPVDSSEKDFFELFVSTDFYNKVAEETNKYAALSQRKAGAVDKNWEDTNAEEIQAYIGILIYMGLVDLPEIDYYFQDDFCVCPIVKQAMTLKRLKKLGQYLHLNDEEDRPDQHTADFDILYKARPALDLMDKFKETYVPGRELAVDEAMIGFKGRFFLKQYLPGKPTKWGIKAWGLADSANGYLLKCEIYKGKKEIRHQDLLLGEQVVLQLTENFWGKWHHIYFDNFFSSTNLMKMLLAQETYSCGTTRANRKNWPAQFRKPAALKLKRGESRKMQHEDVTAVVWQDKHVILLLSTNSDPRTDGSVTRKTGKGNEEIEIPCPNAIINYTKHMGGVDLSDQKRAYYGVGRSSKKWWKFILHFILNVCIVNSFILYDLTNQPATTAHGNRQLTFRRNLVSQLISTFTSHKRTGRKRSLPIGIASPKLFHCIEKISGCAKMCALCI